MNDSERPRRVARIAGALYLLTLATGVLFSEFYVRRQLMVPGDAAATAHNILAHESLFRASIVSDLITFAGDIALVVALYVLLEPTNRGLAILAVLWRLAGETIFAASALSSMVVLELLGGAGYLKPFGADQLQSLSRVLLSAYGSGYRIGGVFYCLGSALFSYLFFRSKAIPRALSGLGLAFSVAVLALQFFFIMAPTALSDASRTAAAKSSSPIMVTEVATGLWLLFRGVRKSPAVGPDRAGG